MFQEKTLVQSIGVLAAVACFMPLVVLPSSFIFPFIVPKILLFRTLVLLMLGAYGLLLSINWQKYRPRLTAINIAVFFFWLSFAISTFVGVDWYRSFWDNHERMLGLFTVSHYVLFYYISVSVLQDKKQWHRLFWWFICGASMVMLLGIVQKIDPQFLLNRGANRVSSTLGNAIYLSGYGLFLLFASTYSYLHVSTKQKYLQYFAIVGAVLGFIGIFLGGTRGTFLALVAASGVLLISYAFLTKQVRRRRIAIGAIIAGLVLGGVLFAARGTTFVQSLPAIGRLAKIDYSSLEDNTRIMSWGVAWESFLERPVLGWGPNNFYYAFNEYYRPEFLRYSFSETWFDNAHNIVMNTLTTQGAFGLVVYLSVFAAVVTRLVYARRELHISDGEFSLLLAFFVGHFVHNIFVFENPTSYLYFFFALAYVHVRTTPVLGIREDARYGSVSTPFAAVVGILILFMVYVFNINPAHANTASLKTIQALHKGRGIEAYQEAKQIPTPHIDDIRNDFARTVSQLYPKLFQAGEQELAKELLDIALTDLEKNIRLHPRDIRMHLMLSQVYQLRGATNQSPADIQRSISLVQEAIEYSPERQQLYFTLGNLYIMVGNTTTAEQLFLEARELDPKVAESSVQLVNFFVNVGDNEKAQEVAQGYLDTYPEEKEKRLKPLKQFLAK